MVKAPAIKFLCSYGGRIVPRHTDGLLRYSGGITRYLAVDRSISFSELMVKLVEFCGSSVVLRCQLPKGDLETLVTIKSDEDLANIIEEYDRASKSAPRPLAIRAVLTPSASLKKPSPSSSLDSDDSPHAAAAKIVDESLSYSISLWPRWQLLPAAGRIPHRREIGGRKITLLPLRSRCLGWKI